jgi:hypothetical protein
MNETWYAILEVSERASPEVIRAAWRSLIQRHHPDRNPAPAAAERARLVNDAYQLLSDPARRAAYDAELARLRQGSARQDSARPSNRPPIVVPPSAPASTTRPAAGRSSGSFWWFAVAMGGLIVFVWSALEPTPTAPAPAASLEVLRPPSVQSNIGAPPPTVLVERSPRPPLRLSFQEELTVQMACSRFQLAGDVANHQLCMTQQESISRATQALPDLSSLPFDVVLTMNMGCNDHQLRGDLAGYRACMHAQIARLR